jgi:hypothetical protein
MYVAAAIPQGLFSKLLVFLPELVPLAAPVVGPALIITSSVVVVTVAGVWIYRRRSQNATAKKSGRDASAPVSSAPAATPLNEAPAAQSQANPISSVSNRSLRQTQLNPETLMSLVKPRHSEGQATDVTVFAPRTAPPREEIVVQVMVHTPELRGEARSRAETFQPSAAQLASTPLQLPLSLNDKIAIQFECPRVTVSDPVQKGVWNGRLICLHFSIELPEFKKEEKFTPKLCVFVNGAAAGTILFIITGRADAEDQPLEYAPQEGRMYRRAFMSYASQDRHAVLHYAGAYELANIEYYLDTLSNRSGEMWEKRIYEEIRKADLFVLFWSSHARKSDWVMKEAEYALKYSKSLSARPWEVLGWAWAYLVRSPAKRPPLDIRPVILEYPPPVPPPSLAEIHFGDPVGPRIVLENLVRVAAASDRFVLKIGSRQTSQLALGMRIEPEMLGAVAKEMGRPIGEVETSPHHFKLLGLRNRSTQTWRATRPTGEGTEVPPGKAVQLTLGLVIDFAEIQGVVEADKDHFVLKIGPLRTPALAPGVRIEPEMLGISDPEVARPIGQVETNPHDPKLVGLRNRSTRSWRAKLPNGEAAEVPPGKAVQLACGLVITFGKIQGVVEAADKPV